MVRTISKAPTAPLPGLVVVRKTTPRSFVIGRTRRVRSPRESSIRSVMRELRSLEPHALTPFACSFRWPSEDVWCTVRMLLEFVSSRRRI